MDDKVVCITTVDNPYNQRTDFKNWYLFDTMKGHHTYSWLARIAKTSDALSDKENEEEIERAIDFMIAHDLENIYKKVKL